MLGLELQLLLLHLGLDLLRRGLRGLWLDLLRREHELLVRALELGRLGQRLAELVGLLRPYQPHRGHRLHVLAKLLQGHQLLSAIARTQADLDLHVHFTGPAARVKGHELIAQAHDLRHVLVSRDQLQHQPEQLLDARLGKGAQRQHQALVGHVADLGHARGGLVQAVSVQPLVVARHADTAFPHGLRQLDALQRFTGHQRRLDGLHSILRRPVAANHTADAVAEHVLDVHLGGHVHVGARVVGQEQAVHILAGQRRGQLLQRCHRVGHGQARDAVRNRDGRPDGVFVAVALFVFQLFGANQHPAPFGDAIPVIVALEEALKQRDLVQAVVGAVIFRVFIDRGVHSQGV